MKASAASPLAVPRGIAGAMDDYLSRILRPGSSAHRPARDAASLVILNDSGGEPRILMGRRGGGHVFLPGVLVFPGGRVEPQDYRVKPRCDFSPAVVAKLAARTGARNPAALARALGMAALRETREETGFAMPAHGPRAPGPDLRRLAFIARALTPCKRPRRFDTRFFCLCVDGVLPRFHATDGELENVDWYALHALARQDLHVVSRVVIETAIARLNAGRLNDPHAPIPFLFARGSSFQRVVI